MKSVVHMIGIMLVCIALPVFAFTHTAEMLESGVIPFTPGQDEFDEYGDQLGTLPSPGTSTTGLAYDGTYLWCTSHSTPTAWQIDFDGNVISSFALPGTYCFDLAFDGENLWFCRYNPHTVYKIDTEGNVLLTITTITQPEGCTFDGENIWVSTFIDQHLHKLDLDGNILQTYDAPDNYLAGMAYGCGGYLWATDQQGMVYQMDLEGITVNSFDTNDSNMGATLAEGYLYISSGTTIRWYDIGDCPPECPLTIDLTPHPAYPQIPAWGGMFTWDVLIANTTETTVWFDGWTMALLPNNNLYGPILLRENLGIGPYGVMNPTGVRTQVPRFAPAGEYMFIARVGDYPEDVCMEASFPFEKLANGFDGETYEEWAASGWDEVTGAVNIPAEFGIEAVYPNPFNPVTTISIALPSNADLQVSVYNVNGQLVQVLADGTAPAGFHSLVFDASNLSSGIYFVQAQSGAMVATHKLMLVK